MEQTKDKLKTTNQVHKALLEHKGVVKIIGDKIYPIATPKDVNGDCITYQRVKYTTIHTSMGVYEHKCQIAIKAISTNYDNSLTLAQQICSCFVGNSSSTELNSELIDSSEDYLDSKYVQNLLFEF